MTDQEAIGAVIDEMYAMISGPAGPRDWGRQANCFLPAEAEVAAKTYVMPEPVSQIMWMMRQPSSGWRKSWIEFGQSL